jgi:hypothetical protein
MSEYLSLLKQAHAKIMNDGDTDKPSPWFGEMYVEFVKLWSQLNQGEAPSRITILNTLCESDVPFRFSGDYSDDYQTMYFNPTHSDNKLMQRLASRKLVSESSEVDKNQTTLFEGG